MVPTNPVRTASQFLHVFGERHAFRFDTPAEQSDEVLEITASMADWIKDLDGVWEDCGATQQLEWARHFVELCEQLEGLGYVCHMGKHRQALYQRGQPDLVFLVGLMSIRKKEEADGQRYALVELEGNWETVKEERMTLPEGFGV